jgi:hypothetical protein
MSPLNFLLSLPLAVEEREQERAYCWDVHPFDKSARSRSELEEVVLKRRSVYSKVYLVDINTNGGLNTDLLRWSLYRVRLPRRRKARLILSAKGEGHAIETNAELHHQHHFKDMTSPMTE